VSMGVSGREQKARALLAQLAHLEAGRLCPADPPGGAGRLGSASPRRLILKGGTILDPAAPDSARRKGLGDLVLENGVVRSGGPGEEACSPGERGRESVVVDCRGRWVIPGIIDLHLHLGDLFDGASRSAWQAAADGVTMALSPGAGNTLMAPALLGAEVDRGFPLDVGVFVGLPAVLACRAGPRGMISFFRGDLDVSEALESVSGNPITVLTGPLAIGIKEHMGHYMASDTSIRAGLELAAAAGLLFVSHTQDPDHAKRVVDLARGLPIHLGHATAAGGGGQAEGLDGLERVIELLSRPGVTGEAVLTHVLPSPESLPGRREGLGLSPRVSRAVVDALAGGGFSFAVSDGQAEATMRGFGDTRDTIPALVWLAREGVSSDLAAVALVSSRPAAYLAETTGQDWWRHVYGHLGAGARGNVTVVDPVRAAAYLTVVGGRVTAFEGRPVPAGAGAGQWVTRYGLLRNLGVGDLPVLSE